VIYSEALRLSIRKREKEINSFSTNFRLELTSREVLVKLGSLNSMMLLQILKKPWSSKMFGRMVRSLR
jgi:hypothetical protein